jgi:hypothetical protein
VGFVANLLVRPAARRQVVHVGRGSRRPAGEDGSRRARRCSTGSFGIGKGGFDATALLAWAVVGLPLAWGVWITLKSTAALF